MARLTWTLSAYASSDAVLRTQLTQLRDNLLACGLVQTSDTGQFDLTSGVRAASANSYFGFLMFRFNDALQASAPVYLKVILYNLPNTIGCWAVNIYIGTATDGAGAMTNVTTQGITNYPWSMTTGNAPVHYMSGDGSRLTIASPNANRSTMDFAYLTIERTKDTTGKDTGEGVVAFWGGYSSAGTHSGGTNTGAVSQYYKQLVWTRTPGQYTYNFRGCSVPPDGGGAYGGNASNVSNLFPWRPYGIREYAPAISILTGFVGSTVTTNATCKVSTYDGSQHEYIGFSSISGLDSGSTLKLMGDYGTDTDLSTTRKTCIFFRWE